MDCKEIFDILTQKNALDQTYEVFEVNDACFFGKDHNNNVVFMIPSMLDRITPVYQETRSLSFAFNKKCTFRNGASEETKTVHMLTCKEGDEEKILAFIRLTKAFTQNDRDNDQFYLAKLFSAISGLFDKERKVSEIELQGLFSELYTILHLLKAGCDISSFWQARNMMKFDFTIDEKKRLEIKSTLKANRTHHFRHDQLLSELYDIRIVSFLLRKSDYGLTLEDLIEAVRDQYADNYALLMHIESLVSHVDKDMLCGIKYDEVYLKENLRYYNADDIPHFNEKTPDGVFNAEYDCSLDTAHSIEESDVIAWIKEGR